MARNGHELVSLVVHEIRNSLASIAGCAQTLMEARSALTPESQDLLAATIAKQAERVDWMMRAVTAMSGDAELAPAELVDPAAVILEAAEHAHVKVEVGIDDDARFVGDGSQVRLALEALFLGLAEGGAEARGVLDGERLEVESTARDLSQRGRLWKLGLANRLLKRQRCVLTIRRTQDGTQARIRFPDSAERTVRRAH